MNQDVVCIYLYLLNIYINISVDKDLIDLHVQMMRRVQLVSARHCQWEKSLLKFCSLVPSLDKEYLQLDRFGYVHLPVSTKLAILKCLCDCQFDFNPKFKDVSIYISGLLNTFYRY